MFFLESNFKFTFDEYTRLASDLIFCFIIGIRPDFDTIDLAIFHLSLNFVV